MFSPTPREYYVFREARNVHELKSLLELRYRGYHQSRCTALIDQNNCGLDIDAYDLRARHMGFFQLKGKESIPLGYMRLIEDEMTSTAPLIWQIAAGNSDLLDKLDQELEAPFPFMTICEEDAALQTFYTESKATNKKMVEGSRFVFDRSVRSRGFPKFVLESAVAVTLFSQQFDYAMLGCLPRHGTFYSRFGFQPFEGYEDFAYGKFRSCILINSTKTVPTTIQHKIVNMAQAFSDTGMICHFPENTEHFQLPQVHRQLQGHFAKAS